MRRHLLFMLAASGCVWPGSVDVSGSGVTTTLAVQTLDCDGRGTLERYMAGAGPIAITVANSTFEPLYNDTASVTGEINDAHDVDGNSGSWQLAVDARGFAGQFKITLSCP